MPQVESTNVAEQTAPASEAAATSPENVTTKAGGSGKSVKKAAKKAAAKKAPAKAAKKAAPKKTAKKAAKASTNGKAERKSNRQASPFLSLDSAGEQTPWNEYNKALVKALVGTKQYHGKSVDQLVKATKVDEKRLMRYIYRGVKGGIIDSERIEGEDFTRFYLTGKGRAINLDKVNV